MSPLLGEQLGRGAETLTYEQLGHGFKTPGKPLPLGLGGLRGWRPGWLGWEVALGSFILSLIGVFTERLLNARLCAG